MHEKPEDAAYIARPLGAVPRCPRHSVEWTREALADAHLLEVTPYPRSRQDASGLTGYSPTAGRVLQVLAYRDLDGDWHGLNAWPASGRDLTSYQQGSSDGEEA